MRLSGLAACSMILASALILTLAEPARAQATKDSWALVDEGLGRGGATQPDGVRRYSFPRSDLTVTLDGVRLKPALALGSWLAFEPTGKEVMVMGDLVLTDSEVNPVLTELLKGGIAVTALHNHLPRSSPHTMYMHVTGHGDPWKLAVALRTALARSATPMQAPPPAAQTPVELDTAALDRIIGRQGKANGGVYQFTVPRPEKLTDGGMPVPATMGSGIAINFQPTSGGQAAATGDFVLTENEVDPVMRALRSAGIEVTALHNHMLADEPRLFFMHFWGTGKATDLAAGLKQALNKTAAR
jgi:hypothetical protein